MKKYVLILIIALGFEMNLSAQNTDSFFTSSYTEYRDSSEDFGNLPSLPNTHGFTYDYQADAPLGGGLLLLTAMGAAYGIRKRRNEK